MVIWSNCVWNPSLTFFGTFQKQQHNKHSNLSSKARCAKVTQVCRFEILFQALFFSSWNCMPPFMFTTKCKHKCLPGETVQKCVSLSTFGRFMASPRLSVMTSLSHRLQVCPFWTAIHIQVCFKNTLAFRVRDVYVKIGRKCLNFRGDMAGTTCHTRQPESDNICFKCILQ